MNNKIIVICGFSASGKDAITKHISDNYDYKMIISTSSRPMRPNESQGNPYNFVTRGLFEQMIIDNEFIEYRKYNTLVNNVPDIWYYGVHEDNIDISKHSYVVVLDIEGHIQFKKYFGKYITSFFIDVVEPERMKRASASRGDFDITEWERRYKDDLLKFSKEIIEREVDYVVENYDFDKCINEIMQKVGNV